MGRCVRYTAILAAVSATLIGLLVSGGLKAAGLFRWQDRWEGFGHLLLGEEGEPFMKGMMPAHHEGTPWGFTHAEMAALDLSGATIVVTGANVGLGYWTAHHLAAAGAQVIMGCRTDAKCTQAAASIRKETGNAKVETTSLDLGSFASIRACAASVSAAHPRLDSLILNAGIMVPPFSLTAEGLESQIGVNHFGHFLLTRLLTPQLKATAKKAGVATVVVVSSAAHYESYPGGILPSLAQLSDPATYNRFMAYGQSKLANVLFAQELSDRLKADGILVNSVHPGGVDTNLGHHIVEAVAAVSQTAADGLQSLKERHLSQVAWHPRDASLTQLYAAVGPALREQRITGRYFHPIARETRPDEHARDAELQQRLWSMSEAFIAEH
jgi:NAD(P)-dependent dehydrogenase (short-subunit alcohol dehydrogenase family)